MFRATLAASKQAAMKTSLSILAVIVSLSLVAQPKPLNMNKRNADGETTQQQADYFIASNESGSRYILDIFNSLSNDSISDPLTSQANTIRSLKNVAPVSSCNLFNFSLSGIGDSEYAIGSDLYLYMTRQHTFTERLTIEIRKFKQEDDVEDFITSKEILPLKEPGWLKFPMQAYLSELIPEGKMHALLRVIIKGQDQAPLDCNDGPISFVYSQVELDRAPYLTLYSYDHRIEKIDYTAILKKLEIERVDDDITSPTRTDERRKRQNEPACQLNDLKIPADKIPMSAILEGATILMPSEVNLGICGGVCTNTLPKEDELKHSLLAHYLLSTNGFSYPDGRVSQCCAPVSYASQTFLIRTPDDRIDLINLLHMRIAKCVCLNIVHLNGGAGR